jgi:hypothetical protein
MYTISKNPYNDLPKLHFNYRLAELQEDVERTTSYLGKFRRTESAAHLQDLIAMTKDESNMFTPIAKEVALSVFDEFKKGVFNAGDSSWKYKESLVLNDIVLPPTINPRIAEMNVKKNGDDIHVYYIAFDIEEIDTAKYTLDIIIELVYKVKYHMMYDPDIEVVRSKKMRYQVPQNRIDYNGNGRYEVIDLVIPALLDKETDLTSKEELVSIESTQIASCKATALDDVQLNIGDVIKVDNTLYEMLVDTSLNSLNLKKDTVKIDHLDVNDGVHYYVDLYSFNQSTSVNTLDESIKNALLYGVIWKWLMLAYPAEAESYLALYNNAKKEVYSRCSIFNRQHNKVPRIL